MLNLKSSEFILPGIALMVSESGGKVKLEDISMKVTYGLIYLPDVLAHYYTPDAIEDLRLLGWTFDPAYDGISFRFNYESKGDIGQNATT